MSDRTCVKDDCDRPVVARGWCNRHWKQWRRENSPSADPPPPGARPREPLAERFWRKVDKSGECWIWKASVNANGYGRIGLGSRADGIALAHRVAYSLMVRPLDDAERLDHKCHVRRCVNPAHLQLTDPGLNGQNRAGADRNSRTGIRGVHWDKQRRKYVGSVSVAGVKHRTLFFVDERDAERAVIELRRRVMTNSLMDHPAD